MSIFVLLSFGLSYGDCSKDIFPIVMSANNVTINKNWNYFYSSHLRPKDTLKVRIYPTIAVKLAQGNALKCPSILTEAKDDAPANKLTKKEFSYNSDLGIGIFGIYSDVQGFAVISVEGDNPNNHDSTQWAFLTGVFLILCLVLFVLLFIHAIMAREKVHYQVEIDE